MWLSNGGAVLSLLPFFLGWFSLVTASAEPPSWRRSDPTHGNSKRCLKPEVRREWRALSVKERADWISAVKVRRSPYWGKPYSKFGSISGDLTFLSVFGQRCPAQGLRRPLSRPRELHRRFPAEQEQFHVRRCVCSSSLCFSWHSSGTKVPFRLHFYPYGSQSAGAFLPRHQYRRKVSP